MKILLLMAFFMFHACGANVQTDSSSGSQLSAENSSNPADIAEKSSAAKSAISKALNNVPSDTWPKIKKAYCALDPIKRASGIDGLILGSVAIGPKFGPFKGDVGSQFVMWNRGGGKVEIKGYWYLMSGVNAPTGSLLDWHWQAGFTTGCKRDPNAYHGYFIQPQAGGIQANIGIDETALMTKAFSEFVNRGDLQAQARSFGTAQKRLNDATNRIVMLKAYLGSLPRTSFKGAEYSFDRAHFDELVGTLGKIKLNYPMDAVKTQDNLEQIIKSVMEDNNNRGGDLRGLSQELDRISQLAAALTHMQTVDVRQHWSKEVVAQFTSLALAFAAQNHKYASMVFPVTVYDRDAVDAAVRSYLKAHETSGPIGYVRRSYDEVQARDTVRWVYELFDGLNEVLAASRDFMLLANNWSANLGMSGVFDPNLEIGGIRHSSPFTGCNAVTFTPSGLAKVVTSATSFVPVLGTMVSVPVNAGRWTFGKMFSWGSSLAQSLATFAGANSAASVIGSFKAQSQYGMSVSYMRSLPLETMKFESETAKSIDGMQNFLKSFSCE